MNVKRFTARTPRDALALVRQAFGEDAIVMSTKPCAEGVEVVAMAPDSVDALERVGARAEQVRAAPVLPEPLSAPPSIAKPPAAARETQRIVAPVLPQTAPRGPALGQAGGRIEPVFGDAASVKDDVEQLSMSTLSFQDYVRERMLKRRQNELAAAVVEADELADSLRAPVSPAAPVAQPAAPIEAARTRLQQKQAATTTPPPVLHDEMASAARGLQAERAREQERKDSVEMMSELRSMRGLIEQRFGALAFMEKLQRQPRQAMLSQKLLDIGFSPALTKKLAEALPDDVAELTWAASVLERNLATGEREAALEDQGGVYALIGATGVGKTTGTAKLAAAFAAQHGAANLGLITLDAYRIGAHEQLRTYGRILGVPVHTAHDRASLDDLLDLLAGKRMVLIDTAGTAQRDNRTRELLEMLGHPSIKRLVVVSASSQGETIEDQLAAYAAPGCRGAVLSKLDEAVKLGPALDAMIRARLKVLAVANGQRVPEDWHRLSANALVQRALRATGAPAWRLDDSDVSLIFAGLPAAAAMPAQAAARSPARA